SLRESKRSLGKARFAGNGHSPWQEVQHSGWTFWPCPSGLAELSDLCVGSPHRAIGTPSDRRLDLEKLL
ncbi:hypothetical protein QWI17_00260, partial [Gilvimarinus sp. SDUM040013]|uniref:hypothetical protein n=1 Tax=Gilvimarinus gilvus TaxID=3058038 RepID=UPI0026727469